MKKQLLAAAIVIAAGSAFAPAPAPAADSRDSVQMIPLKDGGTLYVFSDGRSAATDRNGRIVRVRPGQMLETADGRQVSVGNETSRLENYIHEWKGGGA